MMFEGMGNTVIDGCGVYSIYTGISAQLLVCAKLSPVNHRITTARVVFLAGADSVHCKTLDTCFESFPRGKLSMIWR